MTFSNAMKLTTVVAMLGAISAVPASAAVLTHQWTLNGTTADTFGGPAMSLPDPGGLLANGYDYDMQEGPNVSGAISTNNYSIEMLVTLDGMAGYKKLIDFKNRTSDQGLYFLNGTSNFYSFTGSVGATFAAGTPLHLVATRNGATNAFNFYVNGALQLALNDAAGAAIFSGPSAIVHLMRDDAATGGNEAVSGFLDYVRFYDGALSAAEVSALSPTEVGAAAPSPGALALLGLGMMGIGLLRRRTIG